MDQREARAALRRFRQREARLAGQLEATRAERDDAIRAAARAGLSTRAIASEVGLSFQRISQILRDA